MPFNLKQSNVGYAFLGAFAFFLILTRISSIPVQFTFLEIGKIAGPIAGLIILFLIPTIILFFSLRYLDKKSKINKNPLFRLNTKKALTLISICIFGYILITLLFSMIFFPLVIQTREKTVDTFIEQNREQNLQDKVTNISSFLNENLKSSYKIDYALFEADEQLFSTLLDPQLLKSWNISRADIIMYQGWGSCGQAAILIEELLCKFGYESRRAAFIGIDHGWAEVKNDEGNWLIVDPWYIGNLENIEDLKNLKPAFQEASGVKVIYKNGTIFESSEHGY